MGPSALILIPSRMKEALSDSFKYQLWVDNLRQQGLEIHEIEEIYTRYRHNGEALFGLVLVDATTPEGDKIPPICFIKGQVVSALVVLIDEATAEKHLLLVKQRRICNGGMIYETVAGMVDRDDDPHSVAVREIAEETGLAVDPEQVIALHEAPYYVSTGTSDEAMYFFYTELHLPLTKIRSYHALETGVDHEHEKIFTHVCSIPEAKRLITNTNSLLNLHLYLEAIG